MKRRLVLDQRLPSRKVDLRVLRRLVQTLLTELLGRPVTELGIHILGAPEMTHLNETFLRHGGTTDVITFDYSEGSGTLTLAGDIFVCLDEAERQARRFRVSWQKELARYVVHGILHLCGHDDKRAAARSRMKREENRLLKALASRFELGALAKGALRKERSPSSQ